MVYWTSTRIIQTNVKAPDDLSGALICFCPPRTLEPRVRSEIRVYYHFASLPLHWYNRLATSNYADKEVMLLLNENSQGKIAPGLARTPQIALRPVDEVEVPRLTARLTGRNVR